MHSVSSFRLLCMMHERWHCVWSSTRQNGRKNDKLTWREDGETHTSMSIHKAETPISVTWIRGEIKQSLPLFPWYIRGASKWSKPGYYYRRGQVEHRTRQAERKSGDEISYSTTLRIQTDPCGDADPPAQALHCRFRRYVNGSSQLPLSISRKSSNWTSAPVPESDSPYHPQIPHLLQSVPIPPSGQRPMCNDACMSIQ